jgi:cytosol alanyl aminopeptidase
MIERLRTADSSFLGMTPLRALIALALIAAATCNALATAQNATDPTPPTLRLPDGARPLRYAITLTIVPGRETVPAEIAIDVELAREHAVLWLNAEALSVTHAVIAGRNAPIRVLSGHDSFVGLAFDPPLPAGQHRLMLSYEAEQSRNSTRGIFALQDAGAWYAMTHFEPTSARRAFPCFDEPSYKVPWQLTLRVPHDTVAFSNAFGVDEADDETGMKRVRFRETRPLPSYLVAFAVGPWETVALRRVGMRPTPMRIIVPNGRRADASFAAGAFPPIFERTERWFGIAHPYEKLDHIAIPLTVGFAMENAGLITYGAPTLLAKAGAAAPRFRHGSANLGAHEIAHQWFGNLVSPAWWDDLWLNEAFATWFAEKIVDQWEPDYERGTARVHERAEAMMEDALGTARRIREPIVVPGDIRAAFDSITYRKGATVIGMFEGWIGEQVLRRGVHQYLRARSDGNATTQDFLGALSAVSRRPIAPAFSTFLDQNGVPQIAVTLDCANPRKPTLSLAQRRHVPVGAAAVAAQRWQVPVCVRYRSGATTKQVCTLLTQAAATLPLAGSCPRYVFANAGGKGYYLPDYRGDLLDRLARNRAALSVAEYTSVLYDLRSLVRAGAVDAAVALEWVRATAPSRDRHVTLASIGLASFVRDALASDDHRKRFDGFVREVFVPRARALGFSSKANEHDDDQLLRRSLLRFAAPSDSGLVAQARRLALAWIADRRALDSGLVDTVLPVAARSGDAALFDAMLAEARSTSDRLDRRNLLVAMMSFGDAALAKRGLSLLLDPAFDIREASNALRISHDMAPPRRDVHDFIKASFDAFGQRVQRDTPGSWPSYAERLCSDADRADLEGFWRDRIAAYAGGTRTLVKSLESIELCTRLRAAQGGSVAAYLRRY